MVKYFFGMVILSTLQESFEHSQVDLPNYDFSENLWEWWRKDKDKIDGANQVAYFKNDEIYIQLVFEY